MNNECWGADVRDNLFVASSHDRSVYVFNRKGLLFNLAGPSLIRVAKFSRDGRYLATGPIFDSDVALIDVNTGRKVWGVNVCRDWLRSIAFTEDDSLVICGFRNGHLVAIDKSGNVIWHEYTGEFPMYLEASNGLIYAGGKSRTLFVFYYNGTLKWKLRIPDHVISDGKVLSDGSVVIGTVGGWIYRISKDGKILWRNCIIGIVSSVDASRDFIAVSTMQRNEIFILNKRGTILWSYKATPKPLNDKMLIGATNIHISQDSSRIVAGYGDSYIRMFKIRRP